ncbi:MAG: hypothetical protein JSV64_05440 [Candidatus Bathyarchaeota archaeon]|nr:MAG: hypothetical protein JSV64_05440 [Candidatus Bathyarchaeota archaeon]
MVKKSKIKRKTLFLCEECGLGYVDRETAQMCEDWCRKTATCSLEITKKAVYKPNLSALES